MAFYVLEGLASLFLFHHYIIKYPSTFAHRFKKKGPQLLLEEDNELCPGHSQLSSKLIDQTRTSYSCAEQSTFLWEPDSGMFDFLTTAHHCLVIANFSTF